MDVITIIAQSSSTIVGWCVMALGGTFLVILSSSFVRPKESYWRLSYLLFLPAWVCLIWSTIKGDEIAGRIVAATVAKGKSLDIYNKTMSAINQDFVTQRELFILSLLLLFLFLWLCIYLVWFVFYLDKESSED